MIESKIVADSINGCGNRVTSYILTYPRFIHSEVMTHRLFSRNAASSRAIPVKKMIERIQKEPAMPMYWGKNQKGMQAGQDLNEQEKLEAIQIWLDAMKDAVVWAERLLDIGVHKQIANRILEPFAHMTTLVTATEFGNFFNLRAHPDAQPEFQHLAYLMLEDYENSTPAKLSVGEWHLPFADKYICEGLHTEQLLKIVTARAARVSYLNFEGEIDHQKDYDLHDDLMKNGHWSPFEHAAQALDNSEWYGNFCGWKQYRKFFSKEHQRYFVAEEIRGRRKK